MISRYKEQGYQAERANCVQTHLSEGNSCVVAVIQTKISVAYNLSVESAALMMESYKKDGAETTFLDSSNCMSIAGGYSPGNFCVVVSSEK